MSGGEVIPGNFGREPGQPAEDEADRLAQDDSIRERRIDLAVNDITNYQALIDDSELNPEIKRSYEDSIENTLALLVSDERDEVMTRVDQMKTINIRGDNGEDI